MRSAEPLCEYECRLLQNRMTLALRSAAHPHALLSEPSASPRWHAGTFVVWVWGQGHLNTNSRVHSVDSVRSRCSFSSAPGDSCHGNGAKLQAQTQIPPLVCLFASVMTQQLLQGSQPPPPPPSDLILTHTLLCSSDKVVFCHSLLPTDLNAKQTKIIMRLSRLI